MNEFKKIAKRRILKNKTESYFLIATIALIVATAFLALSLSKNFLDYFILQSGELVGRSFGDVLKSGFRNIAVILVVIFTYLFSVLQLPIDDSFIEWMEKFTNAKMTVIEGNGARTVVPVFQDGNSVFSADAMVENIPAMMIVVMVVLLLVIKVALSTVFSACKRERKNFFAILVASGANKAQLKAYAMYETFYYCLVAIPGGIIIGTISLYATKLGSAILFKNLAKTYPGVSFDINIRFSFIAVLLTGVAVFLFVYRYSKKAFKKISVKTIASDVKARFVVNSGICVMSESPEYYKKRGLHNIISTRNFMNNIGRYARIIFMTLTYTLFVTTTFLMLDIMKSYNKAVFESNSTLLSLNYSLETYFAVIVLAIALTTVISIFCAVSANINGNVSEYALMRSGGTTMQCILDTVRSEGSVCVLTGIISCIISLVAFFMVARLMFVNTMGIGTGNIGRTIILIAISLLVFAFSVVFTTVRMKKKMSNLDMVSVLKEAFY